MDDISAFLPLKDRWKELTTRTTRKDGVSLMAKMYANAVNTGYEFIRIYRHISLAGERGPLTLHFTKEFWRTYQDNEIIGEDRQFHLVSSIERKRKMILAIIERDEVVAPFLNLIDKGDELILEIREPDDTTDEA